MSVVSCANCKQEVIRGFCSFDCLPLVEFHVDPSLEPDQAESLIKLTPSTVISSEEIDKWKEGEGNVQTMVLDENGDNEEECGDFNMQMMSVDAEGNFQKIIATESMLKQMNPAHIFIRKYGPTIPNRYFKSVMPDIPLAQCTNCCKIFYEDDFDLAVLKCNGCPFCRFKEPSNWCKDSSREVDGK